MELLSLDDTNEDIPPPRPKYAPGDKVLGPYKDLLYDGIVRAVSGDAKVGYKYKVHWKGWRKWWDKWLGEKKLLEINAANLSIQKELMMKNNLTQEIMQGFIIRQTSKSDDESLPRSPGKRGRPRKKGPEPVSCSNGSEDMAAASPLLPSTRKIPDYERIKLFPDEHDEPRTRSREFTVYIHAGLRYYLGVDHNLVHIQNRLAKVPATFSVEEIFNKYIQIKRSYWSHDDLNLYSEGIAAIKEYFNLHFRDKILYQSEHEQFLSIFSANTAILPSDIYGAPHLLRCLARIEFELNEAPLCDSTLELVVEVLADILKYLVDDKHEFFGEKNYKHN